MFVCKKNINLLEDIRCVKINLKAKETNSKNDKEPMYCKENGSSNYRDISIIEENMAIRLA